MMTPEAALVWVEQHGYECVGVMFVSRTEPTMGILWLDDKRFPEEVRRELLQKELDGDAVSKTVIRSGSI